MAPSWDCVDATWRDPEELPAGYPLRPVWQSSWQWMTGQAGKAGAGPNGRTSVLQADLEASDWQTRAVAAGELGAGEATPRTVELLGRALGDAHEQVGLNAAYALGRLDERGAAILGEALGSEDGPNIPDDDRTIELGTSEGGRSRNATYGLAVAEASARPVLLKALRDGGPRVRKHAAFALGEHGGRDDRIDQALAAASADGDPEVRSNARYSLGRRSGNGLANAALIESLDDSNVEARIHGALALARRAPNDPAVIAALASALRDQNRYVVGFAAEALGRIGGEQAIKALLPFLQTSRWCAFTKMGESIY
jgi:HEAT repeat protein